jgi:putative transposase
MADLDTRPPLAHASRHGRDGPLYQGRFKSFPIQNDFHMLTVCRYIEQNPLRGGLVDRAEAWRWSSLWHRRHAGEKRIPLLPEWPVARPPDWLELVNAPVSDRDGDAVRRSILRGSPFGNEIWVEGIAELLGIESTLRPRGRPTKGDGGHFRQL